MTTPPERHPKRGKRAIASSDGNGKRIRGKKAPRRGRAPRNSKVTASEARTLLQRVSRDLFWREMQWRELESVAEDGDNAARAALDDFENRSLALIRPLGELADRLEADFDQARARWERLMVLSCVYEEAVVAFADAAPDLYFERIENLIAVVAAARRVIGHELSAEENKTAVIESVVIAQGVEGVAAQARRFLSEVFSDVPGMESTIRSLKPQRSQRSPRCHA